MAEFCIREAIGFRLELMEREAQRELHAAQEESARAGAGMGPSLPAPLLNPEMQHARDFAAGRIG